MYTKLTMNKHHVLLSYLGIISLHPQLLCVIYIYGWRKAQKLLLIHVCSDFRAQYPSIAYITVPDVSTELFYKRVLPVALEVIINIFFSRFIIIVISNLCCLMSRIERYATIGLERSMLLFWKQLKWQITCIHVRLQFIFKMADFNRMAAEDVSFLKT